MCGGGSPPPPLPPPPPPAPPPPPLTLEQPAPVAPAANKVAATNDASLGVAKYRNSNVNTSSGGGATPSGLGISM